MVAALGRKPCCAACVQKVVKSGGRKMPVMMSTCASFSFGDLGREIVGQRLVEADIDDLVAIRP